MVGKPREQFLGQASLIAHTSALPVSTSSGSGVFPNLTRILYELHNAVGELRKDFQLRNGRYPHVFIIS